LLRSVGRMHTVFQARWKRIKNPIKMAKQEFFHRMEIKRLDAYPWMTPGRNLWQSLHSHVWERGRVAQDNTIHLSTLAWLANSMDLSEQSVSEYLLLLKELNKLTPEKLECLADSYNHAPWIHIFNLVLDTEPIQTDRHATLCLLSQILVKMALHPAFFKKMIEEMKDEMIVGFLEESARVPPNDRYEAQKRLESITALLLHIHWQQLGPRQPTYVAFNAIHRCLAVIKRHRRQKRITTSSMSWIFTLCKPPQGHQAQDLAWTLMKSNAHFLGVMPNAFKNKELRNYYIERYIQFVDLQLTGNAADDPDDPRLPNGPNWIWSISMEMSSTASRAIPLQIFVRYLYPRLVQIDESPKYHDTVDLLDRCIAMTQECSPLRATLVILRNRLPGTSISTSKFKAPECMNAWKDAAWLYTTHLWFNTEDDIVFSRKDVEKAFFNEEDEETQKLQEDVFHQMILADDDPALKHTIDKIFKRRGAKMVSISIENPPNFLPLIMPSIGIFRVRPFGQSCSNALNRVNLPLKSGHHGYSWFVILLNCLWILTV
jgi:hypothetical protein